MAKFLRNDEKISGKSTKIFLKFWKYLRKI